MTDYTELKRMAEACGDLNWRAIQENWCEWAIRDDHGYIATMRTKSAKHTGPCPDRESKAKFLCAVTPAAVLALIADNEQLRDGANMRAIRSLRGDCADLLAERDQLKAESQALVSALNDILRVTPMGVEAFGIAALVLGELSGAAMGKGEQS